MRAMLFENAGKPLRQVDLPKPRQVRAKSCSVFGRALFAAPISMLSTAN